MKKIAISLGKNCSSAVWAVRNGLKTITNLNGSDMCPFDLMVSNYKGIVECIKDDFKYFCDSKYLRSKMLINTYYKFGFNHECGEHKKLWVKEKWPNGKDHFIMNNFKYFKERYNRRIQAFRKYLNDKNNYIIFVIKLDNKDKLIDRKLPELRSALKLKYPHLKYEIKII